MRVSTSGYIYAGKLTIRNQAAFKQRLRRAKDGEVVVTVERKQSRRSLAQNAYLWGVVYQLLSDHTGYTVEELHEWAKMKFIPKHVALADANGEVKDDLVIGGSTAKLNKVQFGEYVENIRQFAVNELDCIIPDPEHA